MAEDEELGRHGWRVDGELATTLSIRGTMNEREALAFVRLLEAAQDAEPEVALIVDMSEADGLEAGARKAIIDHERRRPYGVCFVRASFTIKALVGLMLNASRLLGQPLPHAFFDGQELALAWARSPAARVVRKTS